MSAPTACQRLRRRPLWPGVAAVGLPLLVYLTVVALGYDGRTYLRGDSAYYYLTGVSLLADRDLDLSRHLPGELSRHSLDVSVDQRGRLVPKHPILMPLASLPLVRLFGPPGALAFNLLQLGLLAAALYLLARRVASPWAAGAAAALTGAATVLPHYAWNYSPDVFSTLLLVSGLLALLPPNGRASSRRLLAAGFLVGLTVVSKFPLIVLLPLFLLLLPKPVPKSILCFAAGLTLPLLFLAAYNTHLFGAPWVTSYDRMALWTGDGFETYSQRSDFGDPVAAGLFRQLMDRHHGLVATSPLTLLSLAALPWLWRRRPALAALVAGSTAALLLFFSSYRLWNHSHFGNRFLLPVVALAALPLAPAIEAAGKHFARWLSRLRELRPRREGLLYALVVVLHLVPLWSVPYLPTQDGPAHLGNAALFLDLHRHDRPFLASYYELNPGAGPTWGGQLALAGLLGALPPLLAEKLFLSAYLVLLALAVRHALGALRPGAQDLAFLALPLSTSYLYHMGFQSFSWSLVFFCLLLAYWLRRGGSLASWRERFVFAGLGLVIWIGHPVTLIAALLVVAVAGAWLALLGDRGAEAGRDPSSPRGVADRLRRYWVVPLLALSPAALLFGLFALRQPGIAARWLPLDQRLSSLATLDVLASFQRRELWLAGGFAAFLLAMGAIALWAKRRRGDWATADALLPAAVAILGLYMVAPNTLAGGGWISHRLLLLMVLTFVLWLGSQPLASWARRACQVAPCLVALGLVALHGAKYAEISPYLEEYLELAHSSPRGGTLLAATPVPWGVAADGKLLSSRVQPFLNAAGYLTAENGNAVVLLDNYQAAKGHFPVRYRQSLGALAAGGPEAARPPLHDLLEHLQRTGARVDAVLLWGPPDHFLRAPGGPRFVEQLEASFLPVAVSEPTGLGRLFVAKPLLASTQRGLRPDSPTAPDG